MKNKAVIVVEGTSDVNRLQNLIDADFVSVNGSAVSDETILYIKELVKTRTVIVLTDPDYPGLQIRNKIAQAVPEVKHAYVDRAKSSNGKKLGVAECETEEILRALANYVSYDCETHDNLTMEDMVELGLSGSPSSLAKRSKVADHFHIGFGNAKTILKRLNMLNVTRQQLQEITDDCK